MSSLTDAVLPGDVRARFEDAPARPRLRLVGPDERAPTASTPPAAPTVAVDQRRPADRVGIALVAFPGLFAGAGLVALFTAWVGVLPALAVAVFAVVVWAVVR